MHVIKIRTRENKRPTTKQYDAIRRAIHDCLIQQGLKGEITASGKVGQPVGWVDQGIPVQPKGQLLERR
jgi:hypothetical protein